MPNIGASDVSYATWAAGSTTAGPDAPEQVPGRTRRRVIITFPTTGNTTYPAGGVPLTPLSMGAARGLVSSIKVVAQTAIAVDANPMWIWNGSTTAPKLAAFQGSAGGVGVNPFREFATTIATNAAVLTLEVETD